MNHKATSLFTLGALVLSAFAATLARADVYCTASTYNNNGGTEVSYRTADGFNVIAQGGGGGYGFDPDTAAGHQAFSLQTSISDSDLLSRASADNTTGTLHAAVAGTSGAGGNRAQIFDEITFHNATGQPQTVTIVWNVDGSLTLAPEQPGRATYHQDMLMQGPGTILRFVGDGHLEGVPEHSSATYNGEGWISYSCTPRNNGYSGVDCNGTWAAPVGDFTLGFYALIDTTFNCTEAGCVNPISANFGNTGKFGITVPQGVSFSTKGGTLNTGSRLANISTRAAVLGGDNVSIAGFIVTGSVPKKVIIRGVGPSLAGFVSNPMPNPTLQLNRDNTVLTNNDNWADTQQTEIQNSGLAPTNNFESAIIRTLDPGSYTAILRDKNNAPGIGVVQVYDLDTAADSKLANISTRAFIEPGDDVLFAGIIGGGNGSQPKVLINARGPSLAPFGVSNAIPDPLLELHDKNGALVTSNDDWQSDQKDAIAATGVGPTDPKESALLATLLPGEGYTAVIKEAHGASGVALVEVYQLE